MTRFFEVIVSTHDLTDDEAEALFTRVADAAHALDEQVTCGGGWTWEHPSDEDLDTMPAVELRAYLATLPKAELISPPEGVRVIVKED